MLGHFFPALRWEKKIDLGVSTRRLKETPTRVAAITCESEGKDNCCCVLAFYGMLSKKKNNIYILFFDNVNVCF